MARVKRRRCANVAEAAQRIEQLEDALEALTQRVAALESSGFGASLAAVKRRTLVLETMQPFQIVR